MLNENRNEAYGNNGVNYYSSTLDLTFHGYNNRLVKSEFNHLCIKISEGIKVYVKQYTDCISNTINLLNGKVCISNTINLLNGKVYTIFIVRKCA